MGMNPVFYNFFQVIIISGILRLTISLKNHFLLEYKLYKVNFYQKLDSWNQITNH